MTELQKIRIILWVELLLTITALVICAVGLIGV